MRFALLLVLLISGPSLAANQCELQSRPEAIELVGARDRQGIVVQAEFADGSTKDVSASASSLDKPIAITNAFLRPTAEGTATLPSSMQGTPRPCRWS